MASNGADHRVENETAAAGEEDTGAPVAPIVRIEAVDLTTGEEDEDAILALESKLYRFDYEDNKWKERGVGIVKLLKHKETGKVRLVMRQSETLIIRANHLVLPTMLVKRHEADNKSCEWHAADFSDGELKDEFFLMRFRSVENRGKFMKTVDEVIESQQENTSDSNAADTSSVGYGCLWWLLEVCAQLGRRTYVGVI